jgi:hypothetical protein
MCVGFFTSDTRTSNEISYKITPGGHSFNRSITNEPATNILRGKLYKSSWSDMNMSFYNKLSHISYVVLAEI